jgi:hypothetical protein
VLIVQYLMKHSFVELMVVQMVKKHSYVDLMLMKLLYDGQIIKETIMLFKMNIYINVDVITFRVQIDLRYSSFAISVFFTNHFF